MDLGRLPFLSAEIRSKIRTVKGSPVLSSTFESSVPGIYFAGLAAANSFGPVMRFAFGAGFAARRLTETMAKALAHESGVGSGSQRCDQCKVNGLDRLERLMDE